MARVSNELPQYDRVYAISTVAKRGLIELSGDIMTSLEQLWENEQDELENLSKELKTQHTMQQESRNSIAELAKRRTKHRHKSASSADRIDVDDSDVEVEYTKE